MSVGAGSVCVREKVVEGSKQYRPTRVLTGARRSITVNSKPHSFRHSKAPNQIYRKASFWVMATTSESMTVTVTGAGGRTGKIVLQKLLAQPDKFAARGLVRNTKSAEKLQGEGVPADKLYVGDIVNGTEELKKSLAGSDALVIATSAVPQIKPLSLLTVFWKKLLRQEGARPEFSFKEGQFPEQIDWLGQKAQIDAAKEAGVKKVVLISSMGGTDENHPLNKLGNGNILIWKRKAEEYLINSGGMNYTIIHPGGLIDEEGGKRELVLGVDDELLKNTSRSIPRADVAELTVQCLTLAEADNRSIDVITKPPGEGTPTTDYAALLASLKKDCQYSAVAKPALTA
ncbi:probable protein TIC 62, chloroplastic at C-terminar half [Coccomyxa sp. Obi]|nr:probable protein TIC 62, chloroplastic at C-terminar half [Coccomyxa sp. Obi]